MRNPIWRILRPFLGKYKPTLFLAMLAVVGDAAFTSLRPWPLKIVIDKVLGHHKTRVPFVSGWLNSSSVEPRALLLMCCAASLSIALSTGLLTYIYTRAMGSIAQKIVFELRKSVFGHLQRLSLRFHNSQRTGDLLGRLTSDVTALQDILANGVIVFVSNACLLTAMASMMLWLNWRFALVALSVSPLLFLTVFSFTSRIRHATRVARKSDGLLASVAQESLVSIKVVQGLAQEEQLERKFNTHNETSLGAYLQGIRHQARVAPLVDVLASIGLVLVMWYGATGVMTGSLTTGDVIVFFAYVTNLYAPMKALSKLSYSISRATVGVERLLDVIDTKAEVASGPLTLDSDRVSGAVEFERVSFAYGGDRLVLDEISLAISPGERIAIVGTTGAGKSTLVALLPRLIDPTAGRVLLDGVDVRRYRLQSLREQIGLVLQDSLLFSGTIRENIAFGRPESSDEEVLEAARLARVHEFVSQLPLGYETLVAEGGATLSGGQKQRIAIARAILRKAPILIMDEPTSGLDAESEQAVLEAVEAVSHDCTTFIIAHRLATVKHVDRIVVLRNGRLAEMGTHDELLTLNGHYARLYGLQFGQTPAPQALAIPR